MIMQYTLKSKANRVMGYSHGLSWIKSIAESRVAHSMASPVCFDAVLKDVPPPNPREVLSKHRSLMSVSGAL